MNKIIALDNINRSETLEEKFKTAFDVLNHSPSISQDKMLILYAYYKQAVFGDFTEVLDTNKYDISNYIQTFKNNAWQQIKGLTRSEAKSKYIESAILVIEQFYPE